MKFSVIIPTYNRENIVPRAIQSVLNQTIQDFEIIVVDDGSKDNTKDVVCNINDSRIRYIFQHNQGSNPARNNGILNAKGEYLSFLDSDDEWMPTMLEKQLEIYNSDINIGVVYSRLNVIAEGEDEKLFWRPFGVCGDCYADVLTQGYLAPTSVLSAKKEAFDKIGLFDTNLPASQDDDICFRLSKNYRVGFIETPQAKMYMAKSNRISSNQLRVAKGWWMLWCKYEKDIEELCGRDLLGRRFYKSITDFAYLHDRDLLSQAISHYYDKGFSLSITQKILFILQLHTSGILGKIVNRIILKN